ncbi:hypothetical protein L5515_006272 [Caenorhabditis briggsae]|uniref:Uncharacterized protein n=1 Tax=Caenorhabditis briggsae TaxID=6238 RepID=A0AAE9F1Y5_CAEBR|nr:hypothetical protein L5515_006272 [Caenorhabditis briggsae]
MEQREGLYDGKINWDTKKLKFNFTLGLEKLSEKNEGLQAELGKISPEVMEAIAGTSANVSYDALRELDQNRRRQLERELKKLRDTFEARIKDLTEGNKQLREQQKTNQIEHEKLESKLQESETEKGILLNENSTLKCSVQELETEKNAIKATNSELHKKLGTSEERLKDLQEKLEKARRKGEKLQEKLSNLEEQRKAGQKDSEKAVEHMLDLEKKLLEATTQKEKLQKDLIEAARVSEVFKKEQHSKLQQTQRDKEDQKASLEAEIKNLQVRSSELTKNLVIAEEGLENLQERLRGSEQQKTAVQKEKEDAVGKLQDLEGKILQCNKEKEQLQKTVKELEGKIQESVVSNKELEARLQVVDSKKGKLQEENTRLETTVNTLQMNVAELQKSVEQATAANGQHAEKLNASEEKNRDLEGKIANLEESLARRANDSLVLERILNEANAGLERLRAAEENRRESMTPEDPSSETVVAANLQIVHDGVDIIPEFDDFDDTDPQDILSDAEADAEERDQGDVELAGPVDAEHRRDTPADQDAPSTSRRAGKRGLGKNNNDSQAKKIREEKEEKERKMDQEKNERKRRYEERAGTSGSSYQFSRRRRTVGLCDGVEEAEAAGGPSQDKNPRSRSEERLLVEDDQDFDIEAHFEEDAEEEPHVVQPGRRGRKPNKTLEQRKQQTAPAIEAKRRRIEEKKEKKRKEDELKKMLEEARNYSGSPELTD